MDKDDFNKITGFTVMPFKSTVGNILFYLVLIIIGTGIYYWKKNSSNKNDNNIFR